MGSKMNKQSTGHTEWSAREQQAFGTTVFFSPTRGFLDITVNEVPDTRVYVLCDPSMEISNTGKAGCCCWKVSLWLLVACL